MVSSGGDERVVPSPRAVSELGDEGVELELGGAEAALRAAGGELGDEGVELEPGGAGAALRAPGGAELVAFHLVQLGAPVVVGAESDELRHVRLRLVHQQLLRKEARVNGALAGVANSQNHAEKAGGVKVGDDELDVAINRGGMVGLAVACAVWEHKNTCGLPRAVDAENNCSLCSVPSADLGDEKSVATGGFFLVHGHGNVTCDSSTVTLLGSCPSNSRSGKTAATNGLTRHHPRPGPATTQPPLAPSPQRPGGSTPPPQAIQQRSPWAFGSRGGHWSTSSLFCFNKGHICHRGAGAISMCSQEWQNP